MKQLIRRVLREHTREMGEGGNNQMFINATADEVRQEAEKYKGVGKGYGINAFKRESSSAAERARVLGIFDEIDNAIRKRDFYKNLSKDEINKIRKEKRSDINKQNYEKRKKTNGKIKYEEEFVGKHFKILHKNCSVDVELKIDLPNVTRVVFNSLSNANKLETILDFVLNNSDRSIDDNLSIITDNMLLTFIDNMVKSDLECIFPVLEKGTNNIIIDKGSLIEVKNKEWGKSDFLCEVFKPDSHSKFLKRLKEKYGYYNITNYISMLNTLIVNKLLKDVKNKVIGDIRKNTFGVFFSDYVFVKMENITLEWKPIGHARKTRIAINYTVDPKAKKYQLNLTKTDINDIDAVSH
jgi:hypothetical protein